MTVCSMRVIYFSVFPFDIQALNKLGQVESQLNNMDLPRNSAELAERHSYLSQSIVDLSAEATHEGRLLLERISSTDQGADGIRRKVCKESEYKSWLIIIYNISGFIFIF